MKIRGDDTCQYNTTNLFEMAAEKFVIFEGNTQVSYLPNARVHGRGGGAGVWTVSIFQGNGFEMVKLCRTHWTPPPPPPKHTHTENRETFLDPGKILPLKSVTLGWTDGTCSTECDLQNYLCLREVQGG